MLVDGPQSLEAVDEGLVGVGVEGRARSLQPYQLGKEGNGLELHDLVRDVWHYREPVGRMMWLVYDKKILYMGQ